MSAFSGNVALVIRGGKPSRDEEGTVWAGEYPKPEEAFRYRVGSAHNFSVMLRRAQILSSRAIWEAGVDFFAFDKPYVKRLRSCDPATEHHFFVYFDKLLQIKLRARAIGFDKVEDLKQDTFVRVITAVRKDGGVRQPERFGAFVNSVCNNVLLEYYRALRKNQQMDGTQEVPARCWTWRG